MEKTELERDLDDLTRLVEAIKALPAGLIKENAKTYAANLCEHIADAAGTYACIIQDTVGVDW